MAFDLLSGILRLLRTRTTMDTTWPRDVVDVLENVPASDIGAPTPQVFSNGMETYLVYRTEDVDPDWDGTEVQVIDPRNDDVHVLAIVDFIRPNTHRFGVVNDEAARGHPLYRNGLKPYEAYQIRNSSWIDELREIHKVHECYSEETWSRRKHYVFFFHDELFEIVADGFRVALHTTTFRDAALDIVNRMY